MRRPSKFHIFLLVLIILLLSILVISFRSVINAYVVSSDVEQGEPLVRVDRQKLNEVYEWVFSRQTVSLDIDDVSLENEIVEEQLQDDEETNN